MKDSIPTTPLDWMGEATVYGQISTWARSKFEESLRQKGIHRQQMVWYREHLRATDRMRTADKQVEALLEGDGKKEGKKE